MKSLRMSYGEIIRVTINASLLAIFYTLLGVLVSFVLYYIFDEYDDKWKEHSIGFQLADVSLEISILSLVAFWSAHIIELAPPLLHVRKELDLLVDGYISGIFYVFAVFVFMNDLTEKLKFIFDTSLGNHFTKIFPQYGSIIDLSLSYTPPRKTNETKTVE